VGSVQYELRLPTDMVWVHVTLATLTWLTVLWSAAAAGRLLPSVGPLTELDADGAASAAAREPTLAAR